MFSSIYLESLSKSTARPIDGYGQMKPTFVRRLRVTLSKTTYAAAAATLRTVKESITRETPLMIMLTPTSVPIAQAALAGHCM